MNTQNFLRSIRACDGATEQVAARPLKRAVSESVRGDWLIYLAARMAGAPGWPTRLQIVGVLQATAGALGVSFSIAGDPTLAGLPPADFQAACSRIVAAITGVPIEKQRLRGQDNDALARLASEFKGRLLPIAALENFAEK